MVVDWIKELFDPSEFLPRGHCGPWSESLKLSYIVSNALIAVAYFLIPIALYVLWKARRRDVEQPWILLCFVGFITSCGLIHVCDITVFWWPCYRLFTLVSVVTAILSMTTAMLLPQAVRVALNVPTPEQFRRTNAELERAVRQKDEAVDSLRETVAALSRQVKHLEHMRRTGLWVAEQEATLRGLKAVLAAPILNEAPQPT
jgi:hypothetical protein